MHPYFTHPYAVPSARFSARSPTSKPYSCMQALQPWRRIFRDVFAHDRTSGNRPITTCRDDAPGGHVTTAPVTALDKRCVENIPDFEAMIPLLCAALELPVHSVPAAPQSATTLVRGLSWVAANSPTNGELGNPPQSPFAAETPIRASYLVRCSALIQMWKLHRSLHLQLLRPSAAQYPLPRSQQLLSVDEQLTSHCIYCAILTCPLLFLPSNVILSEFCHES